MNFDHLRHRASVVREIPLESVLLLRGADHDQHDPSKWHTEQGPLSVSGPKFMNWRRAVGGGGAIDLVMHLAGVNFSESLRWLEEHLATGHLVANKSTTRSSPQNVSTPKEPTGPLHLPVPDDRLLNRVLEYLTRHRHLPSSLLEPLVECGKLYADNRGNAVFVMVAGKANRPIGAELRGTSATAWHGMAPGTDKDAGYFWIGHPEPKTIVLCESAIDAMSCYRLQPESICISTCGVRATPAWLSGLITRGYEIHCGFDVDQPGENAATRMMTLHPEVQRRRPPAHDWNDALTSTQ